MLTTVRSYFAATMRGHSPGWFGAIAIGSLAAVAALGLRMAIEYFVSGVILFALVFPAVAGATLLGGMRAGLTTMVACQTFIWYFLLPYPGSFRLATPSNAVSLVLATLAQLLLVWAIARYKGAAAALAQSEARRADDLKVALRELDHRTMNNFQLAAAVLRSQSQRSMQTEVTAALSAAVDRLLVLAALHRNLGYGQSSLGHRPLAPLLSEIIGALDRQRPSAAVTITTAFADVSVSHDTALRLGLIANELVTNALKHAFPRGEGRIDVRVARDSDCLLLEVADTGIGMPKEPVAGGGSSLVSSLAKSIGATIRHQSTAGTLVTVRFPLPADDDSTA